MARWTSHKCNKCDFSFTGSGKPDALMMGPTLPVICKGCNNIYDRIVEVIPKEILDLSCGECGSDEFTQWNYEKKKCPECKEGTIEEDKGGFVIMAD